MKRFVPRAGAACMRAGVRRLRTCEGGLSAQQANRREASVAIPKLDRGLPIPEGLDAD
jgi:hypothetical protein